MFPWGGEDSERVQMENSGDKALSCLFVRAMLALLTHNVGMGDLHVALFAQRVQKVAGGLCCH